jgi:uncharacterized membrane protein
MTDTIWQYFFFFFLYSTLGWLSEVSYAALETGKIVNRGFLNGPLCPIYGCGMVAILFFLGPWTTHVGVVFFGGMIITTIVEWIGGAILYRCFHTRWWDYTNERWNIGGYICLKFSLMWGIGSILVVMVFHPILASFVRMIPPIPLMICDIALLCVLGVDLGVSVAAAIGLNRRLSQIDSVRAALRTGSDRITELIGSNVISADELLDEQKLQLALAKLEGRENAQDLKKEIFARRDELAAQYHHAVDSLMQNAHFGAGRLLRAFPDLHSRDYGDAIVFLKERAREGANKAKTLLHKN